MLVEPILSFQVSCVRHSSAVSANRYFGLCHFGLSTLVAAGRCFPLERTRIYAFWENADMKRRLNALRWMKKTIACLQLFRIR